MEGKRREEIETVTGRYSGLCLYVWFRCDQRRGTTRRWRRGRLFVFFSSEGGRNRRGVEMGDGGRQKIVQINAASA